MKTERMRLFRRSGNLMLFVLFDKFLVSEMAFRKSLIRLAGMTLGCCFVRGFDKKSVRKAV